MISVFTPSHDPRWLNECRKSLEAQTYDNWEWIVLLNGGAKWRPDPPSPRIRVSTAPAGLANIGALKALACQKAKGEILLELDHDDLLDRRCLMHVAEQFDKHPEAVFVYSDSAQIREDGSADLSTFDLAHGWKYREAKVMVPARRTVNAVKALEPTPHNMSLIWYAPNHVRAYRATAYRAVGGYDAERLVCDDQDLMARLYQRGEVIHIDRCLYLQRVHPVNTQKDRNAQIQTETVELYGSTLGPNALAWAERNGLLALDLGSGPAGAPDGYQSVDSNPELEADYCDDVFKVFAGLDDNSVGVLRAADFLEHLPTYHKVWFFQEAWRVLAPNGLLLTMTPSTDGRGAWQDPTHISGWNENSFWYHTDRAFAQFVPELLECPFQVSWLQTYYPSPWHQTHFIPYVQANLIAVKPGGDRNGGILAW